MNFFTDIKGAHSCEECESSDHNFILLYCCKEHFLEMEENPFKAIKEMVVDRMIFSPPVECGERMHIFAILMRGIKFFVVPKLARSISPKQK